MQTVESLLKKDFKYLCKKEKLNLFELHLSFQMGSNTHGLQSSINFEENWIDVLTFISPTVLKVKSDYYCHAIQTVNYVNWYTKGAGRFYIDEYGDLAYSFRTNYDLLEKDSPIVIKELETTIAYYSDLFNLFLDVCLGRKSFNDFRQSIDEMWGRE